MKKRNRKLRKVLLALSCMLTLVAVTVGATLAYLTDTAEVVNTFTIGNVGIDLNETDVDNDNDTKNNDYHLVPGQTYTKDPTVTIKANSEPSYVRMLVTVEDYVDLERICSWASSQQITGYMSNVGGAVIEPSVVAVVALDKFTTNMSSAWECVRIKLDRNTSRGVYEFRYKDITLKQDTDYPLDPLFQAIQIPGWMTNNMLKALSAGHAGAPNNPAYGDFGVYDVSLNTTQNFGAPFAIKVEAQAIQAAGFTDADTAWEAFDAQMN